MVQRRNRRSGVEDRWLKIDKTHSAQHGTGKRWRARYVDDQSKEHAKSFTRKSDAQQWLDEIVTSQVTGNYIDPKRGAITFASFYAEWSSRQVWEAGTVRAVKLAASGVTFGDVALADLRASHVEAWINALRARGLEPSTIRTRFVNVRGVLRAAVRDRVIARDPSIGVTLPRVRKADAAMRVPTPSEVAAALLIAAEEMPTLIALAGFAGLRAGEIVGLRLSDVDFLRRTVHVQRQAQRENGRLSLRPPKYGSERTIPLPRSLVTTLSEHARLIVPGDDPDRWLFPSPDPALPISANAAGHRWRKVISQTSASDLHLHHMRHFYASGLIASGLDVVAVQKALGHSSAAVTLSTYSHLWPDSEERLRDAADSLVEQVLANPTADGLRTEIGE